MSVCSLFVNLPVADVARTRAFFAALGFSFNPKFSNEQAVAMVVNEHISCMLLDRRFFQGFTHLPVADAQAATQVLLALQVDSRDEVKALVAKAVSLGGTTPNSVQDHGFMLQHGFSDLDGHHWEVFFMDEAAFPGASAG
jgi:uncharacterized protein